MHRSKPPAARSRASTSRFVRLFSYERIMIVCSCNLLSDTQVRSAVASGATRPRISDVYASLGCTTQCGRCVRTIKALLRESIDVDDRVAAIRAMSSSAAALTADAGHQGSCSLPVSESRGAASAGYSDRDRQQFMTKSAQLEQSLGRRNSA